MRDGAVTPTVAQSKIRGERTRRTTSTATDRARQIEKLERKLAALKRQQRDEQDLELLRVIASSVGDYAFTAGELLEHAGVDATLREAIGCATARQVGKRLARLALCKSSVSMDMKLRCVGRANSGCIWTIAQSP
jgi:hypothetical protein